MKLPNENILSIVGVVLLVCLLGLYRADALSNTPAETVVDTIRDTGPNAVAKDTITQNYYEELLKAERQPEWNITTALREVKRFVLRKPQPAFDPERPRDPADTFVSIAVVGGTVHHDDGFLEHSLKPDADIVHKGVPFRTNRWGHREDSDYEQTKPDGVFRIALVGASNCAGVGVLVEQNFESLLEARLNAEVAGRPGAYGRYEVINFSVPRYHLLERVYMAEFEAPKFNPDLVLVAVTMRDLRRAVYSALGRRIADERDLHYDFLKDIAARAGVRSTDSQSKLEQRLGRFRKELVSACFSQLHEIQQSTGVPLAVLVLRLEVEKIDANLTWQADAAREEGLVTLDVFDAYEDQDPVQTYLTETDYHPSVHGHSILATEIFDDMMADETLRGLLLGAE